MSFRSALYLQLRTIAQGVFGDARVYALGATPAKGTPQRYLTWHRISSEHQRHLGGGSELVMERFDVNVWARRLADAEALADAVRQNLDNYRGTIGSGVDLADVHGVFLDSVEHRFDPGEDGDLQGWHGIRLDIVFWHPETATPV